MKRIRYSILALAMILILGSGSVLAVYAGSVEGSAPAEAGAADSAETEAGTTDPAAAEPTATEKSITDMISSIGTTQAFTMEEVPEEDTLAILQAGLSAASAINQQPWFFVAITNQEVMKEIAGSGMGSMPGPDSMPEGKDKPAFPNGAPDMSNGAPDMSKGAPDMSNGAPAGMSSSPSARASMGDSPLAIVVYKNPGTSSPNPDYDCGLATQNMVLAASSLGYGVKIVSSPTMTLNGENHDQICEKLGVDPAMQAVAVLLIGRTDDSADAVSSASTRETLENRTITIR